MSKSNIPVVKSLEEEILFRRTSRGRYMADYTDPRTGEVIAQERSTRLEYPDPVPVEVPVYLKRPESTDDRIRRLMSEQREWIAWQQREDESEDDEHDFDDHEVDPDVPPTPYEFVTEASANVRRQARIKRYKEARAKKPLPGDSSPADTPPVISGTPPGGEGSERPHEAGDAPPPPPKS